MMMMMTMGGAAGAQHHPLLLHRLLWLLGLLACTASDQKGAQWTHTNKLEAGASGGKVGGDRFVTQNNSVVTAQVGASVILHCKTSSATGGLVSWVRKRDYQLLTVGLNSHSSDDRFSINYVHWDWQLHIRYVQPRDAGMYECQVSSHPPTSLFVQLKVVEAEAEILGAPEKHVKLGSILRLVCIMHHTTEALSYVFWYRGTEMINYESEEGPGSVVVESDEHTSVLMVTSATRLHSGNYTCAPSNTKPASILVHVLNEYPAAMQHGESSSTALDPPPFLLLLALTLLALALSGTRAYRKPTPRSILSSGPAGQPFFFTTTTTVSTSVSSRVGYEQKEEIIPQGDEGMKEMRRHEKQGEVDDDDYREEEQGKKYQVHVLACEVGTSCEAADADVRKTGGVFVTEGVVSYNPHHVGWKNGTGGKEDGSLGVRVCNRGGVEVSGGKILLLHHASSLHLLPPTPTPTRPKCH